MIRSMMLSIRRMICIMICIMILSIRMLSVKIMMCIMMISTMMMSIVIMILSIMIMSIMIMICSKGKIIRKKRLGMGRLMGINVWLIKKITISILIHILIHILISSFIIPIKLINFCFIDTSTLLKTSITKYLHDYIQAYFALL